MYVLNAITIDFPVEGKRIRLFVSDDKGANYATLDFPAALPLNRGQIIKFLRDHFVLEPDKIVWAPHVKIPEV